MGLGRASRSRRCAEFMSGPDRHAFKRPEGDHRFMRRVEATMYEGVNTHIRYAVLFVWSLGLAGACAKAPPPAPPPPPPPPVVDAPDWVFQIPPRPGYVCATGAVDPTFYRQDGRVHAAEAARNELARSIQVQISSVMYDSDTQRGGSVRQYIVSEVVTAVNEGVLSGAEILGYWYDASGSVSRAGMTYAYACMDTKQSVADLAAKLEEAFPDGEHQDQIAAVKDRARAAFDDLEAMENKRAGVAQSKPGEEP